MKPRTICSDHSILPVIRLGCGTLPRDASQIEHKASTRHARSASLRGMHGDRVELTDVSHEHLVNQSLGAGPGQPQDAVAASVVMKARASARLNIG